MTVPYARVLMVQGTTSNAGKSTVAAGLCRYFYRKGWRVAPFKAQNMSLNTAVTSDGLEIGRAQAVQAQAAGIEPEVLMNPVLLKPETDGISQIVVRGRVQCRTTAREYRSFRDRLWPVVTDSLDRLRRRFDLIVIEGAGSPAEINLRDTEIVNMSVALYARAPVLLVGDIDRGGVFASLVGTMHLLSEEERRAVKGFVINKFRGDKSLLLPGIETLHDLTNIPTLGVLPFARIELPEEDSLGLPEQMQFRHGQAAIDVAIIRLPHVSNFDEFAPLARDVDVRFVSEPNELRSPDLIIIPGTKTTIPDLRWLRNVGLADTIVSARRAGCPVLGICGGYQMMGAAISDEHGFDGRPGTAPGLGLLPHSTVFQEGKRTQRVRAKVRRGPGLLAHCEGLIVGGYEIHLGVTVGDTNTPIFDVGPTDLRWEGVDGSTDADGLTAGTYIHGILEDAPFRAALLDAVADISGKPKPTICAQVQNPFEAVADLLEKHMDMARVEDLVLNQ